MSPLADNMWLVFSTVTVHFFFAVFVVVSFSFPSWLGCSLNKNMKVKMYFVLFLDAKWKKMKKQNIYSIWFINLCICASLPRFDVLCGPHVSILAIICISKKKCAFFSISVAISSHRITVFTLSLYFFYSIFSYL